MLHPYSSRGVINVDLNNDGQLEIVVSNNNDALQIFENQSHTNNWIGLDLHTSFTDADIYGAELIIKTEKQTIHRTLQSPQTFLSQSDNRVHIGLGNAIKIDELSINWRNGSQSMFKDIRANQYYAIDKTSKTLTEQHYQKASESHFDNTLSTYSDRALMYLSDLLIATSSSHNTNDDILLIWQHASSTVRKHILEKFASQLTTQGLTNRKKTSVLTFHSLLKLALANDDSDIRALAVKQLKLAELESSMAWLIPRIFDENIDVQCETTETFRFFFDEEEAVTHRKKLAIAPLIRLLESGSPQAVICAANALASAENKRAILPLMEQIKQHNNSKVKVTTIRALGLIRDTNALTLLQQQIKKSISDAPVVASSFIALSRLNDPTLNTQYDHFFKPSGNTQKQILRYDTLNHLFSTPEGIVFPKTKLLDTLHKMTAKLPSTNSHLLQTGVSAQDQAAVHLAALRAIAAAGSPQFENKVLNIIKAKTNARGYINNQKLQLQALITLAMFNTNSSQRQFENELLQQTPIHIESVLHSLIEKHYTFSRQIVLALFQRSDTSALALDLLTRSPNKKASLLFAFLLEKATAQQYGKQLFTLLNLCTKEGLQPPIESLPPLLQSLPESYLQAVDCYLQSPTSPSRASADSSRIMKHNLAIHRMLKSILIDSNIEDDTKNRLLIKAAAQNVIIARTILARRLDSLPKKWLPSALSAIETAGVTTTIEDSLWGLYKNKLQSNELRLQAATLLAGVNRSTLDNKKEKQTNQVITYLFEQFTNNQNNPK